MKPIDVTPYILKFREFLNISYPYLENLMSDHDREEDAFFRENWWQLNWKFLIEGALLTKKDFLEPYNTNRSIFKSPLNEMSTHLILCKAEEGIQLTEQRKNKIITIITTKNDRFLFDYFLTCLDQGPGFGIFPPFDLVNIRTLDGKKCYRIPLDKCKFYIQCCQPL